MSSFQDLQKKDIIYRFEEQKREKLKEMAGLLIEASRGDLHKALDLPKVIRPREFHEDRGNFRALLKGRILVNRDLLKARLKILEEDTEAAGDDRIEKITQIKTQLSLMQGLENGIDEIDRIEEELERMKAGLENGHEPDPSSDPEPKSEKGDERAVNAS